MRNLKFSNLNEIRHILPETKISATNEILRMSANVRIARGFDSKNGEPLQGCCTGKTENRLYASIPKSMGFFNQNSGFWKLVIHWEPVEKVLKWRIHPFRMQRYQWLTSSKFPVLGFFDTYENPSNSAMLGIHNIWQVFKAIKSLVWDEDIGGSMLPLLIN